MSRCDNKSESKENGCGECANCKGEIAHDQISESDRYSESTDNLSSSDNDMPAARNRFYFESKNVVGINILGASGSGKSTLIENTILALEKELKFAVIETERHCNYDIKRIEVTCAQIINVFTGDGCQLYSQIINDALKALKPQNGSILFIENLATPVCPTLYDVGEQKRIVVVSVTEGEDKPLKYPEMYKTADLCLINKTDLLPYVDVDIERLKENIRRVNGSLRCITLSSSPNSGMAEWFDWLRALKTSTKP